MDDDWAVEDLVSGWQRLRPDGGSMTGLEIAQRLLRIGRLLEDVLQEAATEADFSRRGDYEVLALVYRCEPDRLTPVEVATRLRLSPSGVTGKLDRLQREGLLERHQDSDDRRAIRLHITDPGRALVNRAFDRGLDIYGEMIDSVDSHDLDAVRRSLQVLHRHLAIKAAPHPKPLRFPTIGTTN